MGEREGAPDWRQKGDAGRPAKRDWRRAPAAGGSAAPAAPATAGWRLKAGGDEKDARRWYSVRVATWTLIVAGLVILFIYLLWLTPRRTPLLALAVTDYGRSQRSTAIPPNAWAEEDLLRLQELDQREEIVSFARTQYADWKSDRLDGFQELRAAVEKLQNSGSTSVVLYLSAHGVVNGKGQPCLVLPGTTPYRSEQWLPLEELLSYLFPKQEVDRLPHDKLLILDCSRIDVNWRIGVLYNSFAERLAAVVDKVKIPGLVILSSAGRGQIGWTSPQHLKGSVFGYFVAQALRGVADREDEGGDGNHLVSLQELYRYVSVHTQQWTQENWLDRQEPMLLPADADIRALVHAKPGSAASVPQVQDAEKDPRWDDVERLWRRHAELDDAAVYRYHPLAWEEYQHKLLRLEQTLAAGRAYAEEFTELRNRLDELGVGLAQTRPGASLRLHSLPLAAWLQAEPELAAARKQVAALWSPKGRWDLKPEWRCPSSLVAASEVWRICSTGLAIDDWPSALSLMERVSDPRATEFVEIHFLRMLNAYLDPVARAQNRPLVASSLAARRLAERAAVAQRSLGEAYEPLPDERAYYAIKESVDRADALRRSAEDNLFVAGPAALDEARRLYQRVNTDEGRDESYPYSIRRAEQVALAYAARDKAWAKIPYLAQWLFGRLQADAPAHIDDLYLLIQSNHALGAALDQSVAQARWSPQLDDALHAVQEKLDLLLSAFQAEAARLREAAGSDSRTLREIAALLPVPLLTGETRNQLRRKYKEIATLAPRAQQQIPAASGETPVSQYLNRLTRLDRHFVLSILSRAQVARSGEASDLPAAKKTSNDDDDRQERIQLLAAEGDTIRQQLFAGVYGDAEQWSKKTAERLAGDEKDSPAEIRDGVSRADRRVRAAAPLLLEELSRWRDPATDADQGETRLPPACQLRLIDLRHLLLWHCQRAMDDFWGPSPLTPAGPSLFEIAAHDYLVAAERLCPQAKRARCGEVVLGDLLDARMKAARAALRAKADDLYVDKEDESTRGVLETQSADRLPPGTAAVWLSAAAVADPTLPVALTRQSDQPATRRIARPVGNQESQKRIEYWVRNSDPRLEQRTLETMAFYRGHVARSRFVVEQPKTGIDVDFTPPQYPRPMVTVSGRASAGCSTMFILDYSGSMTKTISVPSADKRRTVEMPRYVVARTALEQILHRLVTTDNRFQVGLRMYGHRVGWENNKLVEWDPKNQDRTIARRPTSPLPRDDVELLLPLAPFRESDYEATKARLELLRPLGETPLYLAIKQAAEDLKEKDYSASGGRAPQRNIVAITDGVDETTDENGQWSPSDMLSVEKVLNSPGNENLRLYLVGFHISAQDFEDQVKDIQDPARRREILDDLLRRFEDIKRLAAGTGYRERGRGGFFTATDPDSLTRALEKSLELVQYKIARSRDDVDVAGPLDVNNTATIAQQPGTKVEYQVRVLDREHPASATVELEGGEALELQLSEDGRRLQHRRYEKEKRVDKPDVSDPADPGNAARRYYIAAHIPQWVRNDVEFPVSIQNADPARFSPRPEEFWMQIRPLLPDGQRGRTAYQFYDRAFRSGTPVPILSCVARKWPLEARQAEIQLWFKMRKTPVEERLTVGQIRERGGSWRLAGLDQVSFELQTRRGEGGTRYRIVVIERHAQGSPLDEVKVEMEPAPVHVVRHYNPEGAVVRHTFYFEDSVAATVEGLTVCLTSRQRLLERAVRLPAPFVVDVERRGAVADH
jgi:hypothetical protein